MPDHLRWGWCNNHRNKVHRKCSTLESSQNHPPTTTSLSWTMETLSSMKPIPGAKHAGDRCFRVSVLSFEHLPADCTPPREHPQHPHSSPTAVQRGCSTSLLLFTPLTSGPKALPEAARRAHRTQFSTRHMQLRSREHGPPWVRGIQFWDPASPKVLEPQLLVGALSPLPGLSPHNLPILLPERTRMSAFGFGLAGMAGDRAALESRGSEEDLGAR